MNIEEITKQLQPIAEKLQASGQQLFEWAIRQNYYYGFVDCIVGLIFLAILKIFYDIKKEDEVLGYEGFAICVILVIIAVVFLIMGGDRIVNPEMNAISDLVNHLK